MRKMCKRFLFGFTLTLLLLLNPVTAAHAAFPQQYRDGGDTSATPSAGYYPNTWPDWARPEIEAAITWELMVGYPAGTDRFGSRMFVFNPLNQITRAEFAAITARALGYSPDPATAATSFSDVLPTAWYAGDLGSLVTRHIIVPNERFNGAEPITRVTMAVWLGRAARQENLAQDKPVPAFTDLPATTPGYADILTAVRAGLVTGYEDGTFRPDATFTRAQSAAVTVRLAKQLPGGMTTEEFETWFKTAGTGQASTLFLDAVQPQVGAGYGSYGRALNPGPDHQNRWRRDFTVRLIDQPDAVQAKPVIQSRTVSAFDVVTYNYVGQPWTGTCWGYDSIHVNRVYLRRFPEGWRITDMPHLAFNPWQANDLASWARQPSWYRGGSAYWRRPDGSYAMSSMFSDCYSDRSQFRHLEADEEFIPVSPEGFPWPQQPYPEWRLPTW